MAGAKTVDKRRRSYQATFNSPEGKEVLKDLVVFCGQNKSSYSQNPHEMAFREGRREVWLRIQAHMKISDDDIWKLFEQEKEE